MGLENVDVVEVPDVIETTAPEPKGLDRLAGAGSTPPPSEGNETNLPPPAEEPPVFTPNFKYKVLKEEKEVPDWARGVVTTPEMEKTVRELFEKADGIDAVKSHRDQLSQEVDIYKKEWVPFALEANAALELVKKDDLDGFFEKVGISEKKILEYALHRLNLREDPAKLSAYEDSRKLQNRTAQLEAENQRYQEGYQNLALQQREFELQSHVGRPEILPTVQAFESRLGAGSFKNEVIRRGQFYASQGIDAPVEQVVSEIVNLLGWQGQNPPSPVVPTPPAEPVRHVPPPSLPNFQGKGTSPAKRVPRSTDELRALGKTFKE